MTPKLHELLRSRADLVAVIAGVGKSHAACETGLAAAERTAITGVVTDEHAAAVGSLRTRLELLGKQVAARQAELTRLESDLRSVVQNEFTVICRSGRQLGALLRSVIDRFFREDLEFQAAPVSPGAAYCRPLMVVEGMVSEAESYARDQRLPVDQLLSQLETFARQWKSAEARANALIARLSAPPAPATPV